MLATAALVASGPAQAAAGAAVAGPGAAGRSAAPVTTVRVNPKAGANGSLGSRYIGFAYPSSNINNGGFAYVGNYPALLENFGRGVLRFGGKGVDSPSYPGISASALSGLAKLTRKTGWKVLYSVDMGSFNKTKVTADARRVATGLGTRLMAVACGNEPELWARYHFKPSTYDEAAYLKDVPACVAAVRAGAPKAAVVGPDTYQPSWLAPYGAAVHSAAIPKIGLLADHLYAMTNCGSGNKGATTLLSRQRARLEAGIMGQMSAAASTAGVAYIVDETNSASCGGIKGVSNTYASALWAADWILLGAENGAQGMYFNGDLAQGCLTYSPLCAAGANHYVARPVYYGMLFAHLMGAGATLPVRVSAGSGASDVTAHAVRASGGRVRVMVENLNPVKTTVVLRVAGASGWAAVWRLTGPGLAATSGVRIQGAQVKNSGHFAAKPGHVKCRAGTCRLTLAPYSGIVLRVP